MEVCGDCQNAVIFQTRQEVTKELFPEIYCQAMGVLIDKAIARCSHQTPYPEQDFPDSPDLPEPPVK